jgi:thioesterase domain-containing protein
MIPSSFVALEQLPLTPSGKIDRKALPVPDQASIKIETVDAAPRDPLELALTSIWTKVLKLPSVSIHDNFFELGGHSLAAVVLLSEIRKLTGRTLPLATLFQAGTVAEFAEILRQDGWEPSWSSLVPIRAAGSRSPLFLVHGAEGNVLLYRAVSRYLGSDQPVYGLQSQGLDGKKEVITSVPEMASQYIREIRSVQPSGPYYLGGYCMGGVIAFEIAQQLTANGENVELLFMLDTYNGNASPLKSRLLAPLHLLQNVWFHSINALSLSGKDRRKFLGERLDVTLTRLRILFQAGLQHVIPSANDGQIHLKIKSVNHKALQVYVPKPYDGRVVVIRSKGHFAGFPSPCLGWDECVSGGLEVREIPVYFGGMLVDPYASRLADQVTACLGSAPRASQPTIHAEEHLLAGV